MCITKATVKSLLLSVACVFSVMQFAHAGPDLFIDTDVSLGLDDNITRAQEDVDIEHDTFIAASATLGTNLWRGKTGSISGSTGIGVNQFLDFDGLSNYSISASVDYVFGFGSGFGAPWYAINAGYIFKEFDSTIRDSDTYILGATFGMRIDDLTNLRSAITYKTRESDGIVFDTEDVSWFVNVDWALQKKMTLYTTYKIQQGDTFSTASVATVTTSGPGTLGLILSDGSIPRELDDVFAGELAYQLEATTHIVTIGLNLKRNLRSAYDVSLRFLKSNTDVGLEYENLAIHISYFHKFGIEL